MAAFESDYKEIMRGIESIKGNWFAILNKRGDDDYYPRCGCYSAVPSSLSLSMMMMVVGRPYLILP